MVGCVGESVERKGVGHLIRLWETLNNQKPREVRSEGRSDEPIDMP